MNLVVIYGIAASDYGVFETFYPAKRLREACENRGIMLRFLFPKDLERFLETGDMTWNDPTRTAFLIRGEVDVGLVESAERRGFLCVNSSRALRLANDKWESYRFFASRAIITPETWLWPDIPETRLREGLERGFVAKPRYGLRGKGVFLILGKKALEEALPRLAGSDYILQEYIETSHGKDLRVFFANGSVLAVTERASTDGGLLSNTCTGGTMKAFPSENMPPLLLMETIALADSAGMFYGTADYLFGERLSLCELNGSPGFEALEEATGLDAALAIVDTLLATQAGFSARPTTV